MTKQVQRRRGTATQHTSFTGAEGEISVNTTNKSIHVHDGVTAGGVEAARADMTNVSDANLNARLNGNTLSSLTITSADINGGTIDGTVIGGTTRAAGSFTTATVTGTLGVSDAINYNGASTFFIRSRLNGGGVQIGTETPAGTLYYPIVISGTSDFTAFNTSTSEAMRINASGNVGIGTSSPSAALDVVGNIELNGNVDLSGELNLTSVTNNFVDHYGTLRLRYYDGVSFYDTLSVSPTATVFNDTGRDIDFRIESDTDPNAFVLRGSDGNVGIGTSSPNASSILDAQSTTKGVRFPNMTTTQKNAMANAAGNVVFDTTLGKLCVNTGSGWETITSS